MNDTGQTISQQEAQHHVQQNVQSGGQTAGRTHGRLVGKRLFVTGAGQGIGRAIALACAAEGAEVSASDRSYEKVSLLADGRDGIVPLSLDVTDPAAIRETLATRAVDVLVNCAGWVAAGSIGEASEEDWARSFEINVTAMFRTIKAVLPGMVERGFGSIINISSVVSSISGVPNRAAYGASKAAVIGLTKAVAADVIDRHVRCNAVAPGTTASPSLDERIAAFDDPVAARRDFIARQPMGRLGRPEEIAAAVVWLAGDDSAFVTGTVVVVDGGQTL
ncbi:MAG: SDR family oxidoreductase [Bifidobacteriaceae bacterium]|jgi:2-keto-3-deoxy-L-fuconate dehydrogenase|nr:SDR family oxidoreductase [Bifidobacteriaceae bacterium]